jgi:polyhydroxyalkanoate synthesis regulator phasin
MRSIQPVREVLMKRLIWLPIAGFLLIAGATVAMAAPALLSSVTGSPVAADPTASPTTTTVDPAHPGQDLLNQVLADLVTKGTITQAQSDAITQGIQDKISQAQADAQARRTLLESIVADGVITKDEINQLPANDPLRVAFDSIANNGQVTLDQLRGLGPGFGPGFGGPGDQMHGPGGPWFGPDTDNDSGNPSTTPSPSPSTTSNS